MSGGTVLVVSPYKAEYGPPQTLEHVCRALAAAGFRPVCVVPPGAHITDELRLLDPVVHELAGLSTFPRTLNPLRLARFFGDHVAAANRINEIAAEEDARAIYSISEAIFAGSLAARQMDLASVVHVIGMSIRSPRWGGSVYVRFLSRISDQFLACSAAVADMLAGYGVEDARITVVHNGISVAAVDAAAALPAPTAHDGPRIGVVAAYDPRKGHELFVEAAALVARSHPNARFYVIGGILEGQRESIAFQRRVEELIRRLGLADQVELTGFVPRPDVYAWIRAMDVIVVPSRTEAFAHALLEAMAAERAVVATGIEGNLDAFVHGHSGVYVDPRPDDVARVVSSLIDEPALRARMGAAARERVRMLFDLDVTLPSIGHTVSYLLDARGRELRDADGGRSPGAAELTQGPGRV
jgi:glycosyltransferase involved in cell wall biosynthesis